MASSGASGPSKGFFTGSNGDRSNFGNGSQRFRTASMAGHTPSAPAESAQRSSAPLSLTTPKTTSAATTTTSSSAINFTKSTSKEAGENASLAASVPSSVPKSGRRRDSISSQMRKLMTDSPAAAAGGGLNFQRSMGQTFAPMLAASRPDKTGLSASLGSIGEISSASHQAASIQGTLQGRPERSGHTHFGQECHVGGNRRGSVSSVTTDADDDKSSVAGSGSGEGRGHTLHRCEACGKVYRHPSCLIKHRWEHTVYWKEASKFLLSKHQQVQLLEAAAILVGMDVESRSLPEEKALWPAAVSPATSGLLGSDKINFDMLMAMKQASKKTAASPSSKDLGTSLHKNIVPPTSPSTVRSAGSSSQTPSYATSLPTGQASTLSPMSYMNVLHSRRYGGGHGDIASLRLDESAERSVREESQGTSENNGDADFDNDRDEDGYAYDDEEQDENMTGSTSISAGSPSPREGCGSERSGSRSNCERVAREQYGVGAGGDVMAEMDMELEGTA